MTDKNSLQMISKYRSQIMGFAALWIVIFHTWTPVLYRKGFRFLDDMEIFIKTTGFAGVDMFMFLSGFGLVSAIQKHDLLTFYRRRFIRLYIPFFVSGIYIAFVRDWEFSFFIRNITFYDHITKNFLSLHWFVAAILVLYLLFPLYYRMFQKASDKVLFTACVLVVWLLLSMVLTEVPRQELYAFTNRIPVFLLGVLTGGWLQERELIMSPLAWLLCFLVLALGFYLAWLTNYHDFYLLVPYSNCCIPNLLITVPGVFFLGKFFWWMDHGFRKFGQGVLKVFAFFGIISLEFYCVQEYISTDVKNWLGENFPVSSEMCNVIVLSCIMVGTMILYGICHLPAQLRDNGRTARQMSPDGCKGEERAEQSV